jgi:hypothetical protein
VPWDSSAVIRLHPVAGDGRDLFGRAPASSRVGPAGPPKG